MDASRFYSRRGFLSTGFKLTAMAGMASLPTGLIADADSEIITILHTNDTHSRIDPFPAGDPKYAGMGGVARRMSLINRIRSENRHVLLLDSGDFFQGTPYFNLFKGELELKMMSMLGYDAATMGNHDFDNGPEGLSLQLKHAKFPLINSNYSLENTALKGLTVPYKVFKKGRINIGVLGLGINLKGLVSEELSKDVIYRDPIPVASRTARLLRHELNCDVVICLSHLGYSYDQKEKVSDVSLAASTTDIDLILGGHTHTFLDKPFVQKNPENKNVVIGQSGWGGLRLGRYDIMIEGKRRKLKLRSSTVKIS